MWRIRAREQAYGRMRVCVYTCVRVHMKARENGERVGESERETARVDVVGLRLTRAAPHSDTSAVATMPTHTGLPQRP